MLFALIHKHIILRENLVLPVIVYMSLIKRYSYQTTWKLAHSHSRALDEMFYLVDV